jgi:hypothetical protein
MQASVVDIDIDMHHLVRAWLNPTKSMDRDRWINWVTRALCTLFFFHDFNAEQLLVSVGEVLITVETLPILATLGDLDRGQPLDYWGRFSRRCG